ATKFSLAPDDLKQTELRPQAVRFEQHLARVEAHKVLPIPCAMIVALTRKQFFVPRRKTVVDEQVQFEMDMRAFLRDALVRVGGVAHDGDGFARLDRLSEPQVTPDFAQVRVSRVNLQTVHGMTEDDVIAEVRERRLRIDVGDGAIGGGHHRIRGFAPLVALEAADIEALMHLPTPAADTTETAARPRLAHRAN